MTFKKPSVIKTKADIQSLTIFLRSVRKWGKSTAYRDLILEKYGDPECGLLIGIGNEIGYNLLDNLNATQVESWKDLKDLKKWLINEKGKEHNIKIVAFDVVEELIPLAEAEVIRLSNSEGKPATTLNNALGGYGEGRKRLQKILKEYFTELRKAGFGIFCIGHTKVKTIKEKGDDTEGYNVLSSTLSNDYESIFSDIFDVVLTGTIEKTIDGKIITGEERRLYFRSTGYIDAGCRFSNDAVPEYIVYDNNFAKTFLDTLEEGLRKSKTNPVSKEEFKKEQVKEVKELENKQPEPREEELELKISKGEVVDKLKVNMGKIDMKELQAIMSAHGVLTFANPESLSTEFCIEVLKLIEGEE